MDKDDGAVADEVESRLEDLFGESGESAVFVEEDGANEDSPLRGLKTTLLSIDWEISDEVMTALIKEVGRLEGTYKDDKTLLLFLRLLGSVGKYIKTNKANAHPDAIKLLNSVYNSMEKVVLSEGITEAQKKQTLVTQVKEFKKLKEEIALGKADAAEEKEVKPVEERMPPEASRMPPHEAFVYALEEIKQVINAEFRALRAELKLWREGE